VNSSLTYLSNNKKKVQFSDLQFTSEKSDSGVMVKELEHKIQEALSKLPPKCKTVFVLSRFEERKNKEIAEILGLSIKTVENQMGIALKKLREDLKPYLGKDVLALSFGLGLTAIVLRSLLTVSAQ
jgi:RNA polymerase sigma-70 factor, ECF subfamily